jgi:hypothetical protein
MRRTTIGILILTVLVAVIAAGCGSSGGNGSAGAPSSTAAPATTTTPPTTAATTTTRSAAAARCSSPVLLEAAQKALKDSGSTMAITSITLARCRNGYALLSAHPASGAGESPNVFLVWRPAAGAWEALDLGTGIDCAGSPIGPKLTAACKALGYPVRD